MSLISISNKETATVLAALRYFQRVAGANGVPAVVRGHFDEHGPLSLEGIDELCERINIPPKLGYVLVDIDAEELVGRTIYPSATEADCDLDPQLDDVIAVPILYNLREQEDPEDQEVSDAEDPPAVEGT